MNARVGPFAVLLALLAAAPLSADEAEDRAVKAVESLGGGVLRDEGAPGRPVVAVRLRGTSTSDKHLGDLAAFKRLQRLDLSETNLTGVGLKELGGLTELRELRLYRCLDLKPEGVKELARLPHLRKLNVVNTNWSDRLMKELAAAKQLQELDLSDTFFFTDKGVAELTALEGLQVLGLRACPALTAGGLRKLAGLKELRVLDFSDNKVQNLEVGKALASIAGLREVSLCYCFGLGTDDLEALAGLKNLEVLDLSDNMGRFTRAHHIFDGHLRGLRQLKGLRELRLSACDNVTDKGLAELAALEGLEKLDVSSTTKAPKGLKHLAGLKRLRALDVSNSFVTNDDLKGLAGLASLRELTLRRCPHITPAGLGEALAGLDGLQTLDISEVHLRTGARDKDEPLRSVARLSGLRELRLCGTGGVTAAGLKELTALKNLRALDLSMAGFVHDEEDVGPKLKGLAGLTQLEALDLSGTHISNAELKELAVLKQLRSLKIEKGRGRTAGPKVTDEGVAELQRALPDCRIVR
jgi:Leucine-rich repeat (LRR) protein